jgi:hypothetical protein
MENRMDYRRWGMWSERQGDEMVLIAAVYFDLRRRAMKTNLLMMAAMFGAMVTGAQAQPA